MMKNLIKAIKLGLIPAVLLTLLIIGHAIYEIATDVEVSISKVFAYIVLAFVISTIIEYRKEAWYERRDI